MLCLRPVGFVQEGPGRAVPHKLISDKPQPSDLLKGLCCFVRPGQLVRVSLHCPAPVTLHSITAEGLKRAPVPFSSSPDSTIWLSFCTLHHQADAARYYHLSSSIYLALPTVIQSNTDPTAQHTDKLHKWASEKKAGAQFPGKAASETL